MNKIVAEGTGVAHQHALEVNEHDVVFRGTEANGDTVFEQTFSYEDIDFVLLSLDRRLSIQSGRIVVSIPTSGNDDQHTIEALVARLRDTVQEA
jgi:hypothetical protein